MGGNKTKQAALEELGPRILLALDDIGVRHAAAIIDECDASTYRDWRFRIALCFPSDLGKGEFPPSNYGTLEVRTTDDPFVQNARRFHFGIDTPAGEWSWFCHTTGTPDSDELLAHMRRAVKVSEESCQRQLNWIRERHRYLDEQAALRARFPGGIQSAVLPVTAPGLL